MFRIYNLLMLQLKNLKIPELKTTKNPTAALGFKPVVSYKNESDKNMR